MMVMMMKMWRGESPLFRNCHTGRPLVAHQHCCQQFKPRWSQKLWRSWWWWFIFWQWQSPLSLTPSVKATCHIADGTKHPTLCDSDPKQEICDQQEKESFCSNQLAPHPLSPSKSPPPPPQPLPGSIGRDSRCHCGSISPHPSLSSSNFQTLWNFIKQLGNSLVWKYIFEVLLMLAESSACFLDFC